MKRILINLFGKEWYCKMFHSKIGITENDKPKWYCKKCNISYFKTLVDTGPR